MRSVLLLVIVSLLSGCGDSKESSPNQDPNNQNNSSNSSNPSINKCGYVFEEESASDKIQIEKALLGDMGGKWIEPNYQSSCTTTTVDGQPACVNYGMEFDFVSNKFGTIQFQRPSVSDFIQKITAPRYNAFRLSKLLKGFKDGTYRAIELKISGVADSYNTCATFVYNYDVSVTRLNISNSYTSYITGNGEQTKLESILTPSLSFKQYKRY